MTDSQQAALLWMLECPPEIEDEWNEWYSLEHFANLVRVPGFLSGTRYRQVQATALGSATTGDTVPRYLTFYELQDRKVLESEAYMTHRTSSGPGMRFHWNKRMVALVSRVVGGPYYLHAGQWFSGASRSPRSLWMLGLDHGPAGPQALDAWLEATLLPALSDCEGVAATQVLGAFKDAPAVTSKNSRRGWSRIVMCALAERSMPAQAARLIERVVTAAEPSCTNATAVTYEIMHT